MLEENKMSLLSITRAAYKCQLITEYLKLKSKLTMNYFLNLNANIILRSIDSDI